MATLAVSSFFADVAPALGFFASDAVATLAEPEVDAVPDDAALGAPEFAVELEPKLDENATTGFGAELSLAPPPFVPAAVALELALGVAVAPERFDELDAATTAFGFNPQLGVAVEPEEELADAEEFAEVDGDAS